MSMPFDVFILSCAPCEQSPPETGRLQKENRLPSTIFPGVNSLLASGSCNNSEGFSDRSIRHGLLNTLADGLWPKNIETFAAKDDT